MFFIYIFQVNDQLYSHKSQITRRNNNVVLSILAREKSFWELVKNIYLPGHFPRDPESIV